MMMCVKVRNFLKEAGLKWNIGGTGSTLQFKSLTSTTNKQIKIGEVEVQRKMFWLMLIWFTYRILGKKFEVEHAWLLLKDQPKFNAEFMSKCSKRTNVSASGNYSLSSNPETPIEVKEYDTSSPMSRPIGQKAAKRKSKEKEASNTLDLSDMESVMKDKNVNTSKLIQVKEA